MSMRDLNYLKKESNKRKILQENKWIKKTQTFSIYFAQDLLRRSKILDFSIMDLSILDSDTLYPGILDSDFPDLTS